VAQMLSYLMMTIVVLVIVEMVLIMTMEGKQTEMIPIVILIQVFGRDTTRAVLRPIEITTPPVADPKVIV
jgi:hypothetical protein